MPICPNCNLGIPPSFVVCPDCGRKLVELASVAVLEEEIEFVEIHSLSEMLVEFLPDDPDAEVLPSNGDLELREADPEPEPEPEPEPKPRLEQPKAKSSPRRVRPKRDRERPAAKLKRVRRPRPKPQVRPPDVEQAAQPEPEPEAEMPALKSSDDRAARPTRTPRKKKRARRARTEREPSAPIEVHLEDEQPVVTAEPDDDGSDEDQFVATDRGFARIHRPAELEPSASTVAGAHPVRWAHRAYRGEVEMSGTGSRAGTTLVIFGDGLLIGSGASGSGFGSVRGLLSGGSSARKRQKLLSLAGSSAEGQSLFPGSRRWTPAEIEIVRIDKGGALHRELTIRTAAEETLRYRFPAKRHGDVANLLSRVLGAKLFDAVRAAKAARTG